MLIRHPASSNKRHQDPKNAPSPSYANMVVQSAFQSKSNTSDMDSHGPMSESQHRYIHIVLPAELAWVMGVHEDLMPTIRCSHAQEGRAYEAFFIRLRQRRMLLQSVPCPSVPFLHAGSFLHYDAPECREALQGDFSSNGHAFSTSAGNLIFVGAPVA